MKLNWNFLGERMVFSGTAQYHLKVSYHLAAGADLGGGSRGCTTPPPPRDDQRLSNTTGILKKKKPQPQLRHSLVVQPLLRKILDPPLSRRWKLHPGLQESGRTQRIKNYWKCHDVKLLCDVNELLSCVMQ